MTNSIFGDVMPEIHWEWLAADHKRFWQENLWMQSSHRTNSGIGNYIVCNRFVVVTRVRSIRNLAHLINKGWNLIQTSSITTQIFNYYNWIWFYEHPNQKTLTYFSPAWHFYTPWKCQKTFGFLTFSRGIEMWNWTKMG